MSFFLVQASYTPEALAAMMQNPEDRTPAVRSLVEKLGGTLEGFWFCLGDYDALEIYQVPDIVTAAAFSFAVSQTERFKTVKTTTLLTSEEAIFAMRKARDAGYQAPGRKVLMPSLLCRCSSCICCSLAYTSRRICGQGRRKSDDVMSSELG